jgi:hypothetical protein
MMRKIDVDKKGIPNNNQNGELKYIEKSLANITIKEECEDEKLPSLGKIQTYSSQSTKDLVEFAKMCNLGKYDN